MIDKGRRPEGNKNPSGVSTDQPTGASGVSTDQPTGASGVSTDQPTGLEAIANRREYTNANV